jgi:von Willebrand factor type A domain
MGPFELYKTSYQSNGIYANPQWLGRTHTGSGRPFANAKAMLTASNPQDEFFLMTFADRPMLVQDFTSDVDDVRGQLLFTKSKGCTSLIDAIVMAISHMRNARYQRRALVIISDGGDNRSRAPPLNVTGCYAGLPSLTRLEKADRVALQAQRV